LLGRAGSIEKCTLAVDFSDQLRTARVWR